MIALTVAACARGGNYSDEMKITDRPEISKTQGSKAVERSGDHPGSRYYSSVDFYNAKSADTLTILPKFKTLQQSSIYSCGPATAMMVLEYFGRLDNWNEHSLAEFRAKKNLPWPTTLSDMINIFKQVGGFEIISTHDYDANMDATAKAEMIENFIKSGLPVMVLWNDFGGHWQTIIGYDNMGTETKDDDVLVVADSYDVTDHNQDGYGVYSAKRFVENWTLGRMMGPNPKDNDFLFVVVKPKD